jgi:hypothetical protein
LIQRLRYQGDENGMRMQELIVMQADGVVRLSFHGRLSILGGLDAAERENVVEVLHRAMHGSVDHAELRYLDAAGRRLLVRRSGGRRRVSILDEAGTGDASVPGPEDLPRITHISARDLGMLPGVPGEGDVSVPQLVERLIGWLGRARNAGSRGSASLAVLSEPLRGLEESQVRSLLDAVERLSSMVQVVYLTGDDSVVNWANERMTSGNLTLVESLQSIG